MGGKWMLWRLARLRKITHDDEEYEEDRTDENHHLLETKPMQEDLRFYLHSDRGVCPKLRDYCSTRPCQSLEYSPCAIEIAVHEPLWADRMRLANKTSAGQQTSNAGIPLSSAQSFGRAIRSL